MADSLKLSKILLFGAVRSQSRGLSPNTIRTLTTVTNMKTSPLHAANKTRLLNSRLTGTNFAGIVCEVFQHIVLQVSPQNDRDALANPANGRGVSVRE